MTTRKTSALIKAIKSDLSTIGNQVGRKRHASLAALGGRIYANRRKVLRALEYYEREFGTEVYNDLVPAAPRPPTGRLMGSSDSAKDDSMQTPSAEAGE